MLFNVGCVTKGVWGAKAYRPVSLVSLEASPESEDVLVRYDHNCFTFPFSRSKTNTARACWLLTSTNLPKNCPFQFVDATLSTNGLSVPLTQLNSTRWQIAS